MTWAVALPVVIPLLGAALMVSTDHMAPEIFHHAVMVASAVAAAVFAVLVMAEAEAGTKVHWFGAWHPRDGIAVGIDFAADPLGAGMAAFASCLVVLTVVYSLTYMNQEARMYDVLILAFLAGMNGFALTGDLFNMFVWFELMGVAAYALAGFKVRELGPVQGAFNFAITNTVGAYLILTGIALLYARTGALNLAQIGRTLAGQKPSTLAVCAMTLLLVGFLIKGAIVPFHFWLADAHAVAPAPACVLFSGAMVELGLLGVARVYWTIFDAPFGGSQEVIRDTLLWLGLVTALLGALMTLLQSHVKRLLAFSTISHAGAMLAGIALLDSKGLAGMANLVLSHGLLKGGLFLLCGVLLARFRIVDELRLHGCGRALPVAGAAFMLGAVGLIGLPYVGTFLGHSLVDESGAMTHHTWVAPLLAIATGVSSGAILRAGARIFLGWGPKDDPLLQQQPPEEPAERDVKLPLMTGVAALAVVLGLATSVVPGLQQRTEVGADRFRDRVAYADRVLHGKEKPIPKHRLPSSLVPAKSESVAWGLAAGAIALAAAAFGLWRRRLPRTLVELPGRVLAPAVAGVKQLHSGLIGDYVTWIAAGAAVIGGIWMLTLL